MVDTRLALTEVRDLKTHDDWRTYSEAAHYAPYRWHIFPRPAFAAEAEFLTQYWQLKASMEPTA